MSVLLVLVCDELIESVLVCDELIVSISAITKAAHEPPDTGALLLEIPGQFPSRARTSLKS